MLYILNVSRSSGIRVSLVPTVNIGYALVSGECVELPKRRGASLPAAVQKDLAVASSTLRLVACALKSRLRRQCGTGSYAKFLRNRTSCNSLPSAALSAFAAPSRLKPIAS